jgi:calcium-dependent protein kinase
MEELQHAISRVLDKASVEVVQQLFDEIDMDMNGTIDYNEFLSAASNKESLLSDANLNLCFRKIDRNKDGYITKKSVRRAFGIKHEDIDEFWESFMKDVHTANPEKISQLEFRDAMRKLAIPRIKVIKDVMKTSIMTRLKNVPV